MSDVREIYGADAWQREHFDLLAEEAARIAHAALTSNMLFAMPVNVTETSQDGHSSTVQPTVKRAIIDPITGERSFEEIPIHPDVPIHFAGGGGVTATHPIKRGDEGNLLYFSRSISPWRQSGGLQPPLNTVINHPGDSVLLPGVRSDPRKLHQVSTEAHHVRSDDKKHVQETHPQNGHRTFSADPSTAPASATFDPLSMASKFVDHAVQGAKGLLARAVSGGTTHDHGIDFGTGPFMRAANALHTMLCHATNGPSMNAQNGLHQVLAHPFIGAALMGQNGASSVIAKATLALQSSSGISLSCPSGGLSLPSGGVGSSALAPGAAAANIGSVGGDVAGTLPTLQVIAIGNVDATNLTHAGNDSAAAGMGVSVGHLYVNTGAVSGVGLIVARLV